MQKKLPSFVLLLGVISTLLVMPLTAFAQGQGGGRDQAPGQTRPSTSNVFPIQGSGSTNTNVPADFTGQFTVTNFSRAADGTLNAVGTVAGSVNLAGVPTDGPSQPVTVPVQSINGKPLPGGAADTLDETGAADLQIAQVAACDILNLVLGPLHLNVAGLVVDLNQVILNITGQPGPGNLVGNLLCAVLGLLDRNGTLDIITTLLNAIHDILRLPA
jgi:hypothetical protein